MKGFIPHVIENTETEALYHLAAKDNKTYYIGQALTLDTGKVTPDVSGAVPKYLCRTAVEIESGASGVVACTPLRADIIYETEVGENALSSSAAGTAVGVDSDGMTITDASGYSDVFEIVEAAGTTEKSKALVRLLK